MNANPTAATITMSGHRLIPVILWEPWDSTQSDGQLGNDRVLFIRDRSALGSRCRKLRFQGKLIACMRVRPRLLSSASDSLGLWMDIIQDRRR
jgi:hypothetical protein